MKGIEFYKLLESGSKPVITCQKGMADYETVLNEGMKGRVIKVEPAAGDVFKIYVDMTEFEAYNDPLMHSNYWNRSIGNGSEVANQTAKEAGQYPKNNVETVYLDYDTDLSGYFELEV